MSSVHIFLLFLMNSNCNNMRLLMNAKTFPLDLILNLATTALRCVA